MRAIALRYQTMRARGALQPTWIRQARLIDEALDPSVAVMIFGVGFRVAIAQLLHVFSRRPVLFAGKEPSARAISFS